MGVKLSFKIISDGSCDLTAEQQQQWDIDVVPFYTSFDKVHYSKDEDVDAFYQKMVENPNLFPSTSLPSVQDYIDAFLPYITQGIEVLCICITTKFSGSYTSAVNAKEEIMQKYPNAQITVVDSHVNTLLQGLLVHEAARMRDRGYTSTQVAEKLEELSKDARIIFTIGSMDYLIHGGRIGKLSGMAINTLRIKPIITLKEGEIFPSGVAIGRGKSLRRVIHSTLAYLEKMAAKLDDYLLIVGYGYDLLEAKSFQKALWEQLKSLGRTAEIPLGRIGATIAVHTGPHPLGVGIVKQFDK